MNSGFGNRESFPEMAMEVQVLTKELMEEASAILCEMSKPTVMPPHGKNVVWMSTIQPLLAWADALGKGRSWLRESTLS